MAKEVDLLGVLPLLSRLSKRDLALVRAAADRLLGVPAPAASPLYEALLTVAGVKMPFTKFQRTTAYKSWGENEKLVLGFVVDTWGDPGRVPTHALLVYLIEMLADDLKRRKVPVSVGTLAMNLSSVPQVFEAQFPGYRMDGMASVILQAMVRK